MTDLLASAGRTAAAFRAGLAERRVAPDIDMAMLRKTFGGPLPAGPVAPEQVIAELVTAAEPGLVATAGPRFFGFVIGGSLPAATAADMLAVGWDQCAFNAVLSPSAAVAEETAGAWLKQLLGLPASASVGFVSGGQEANTVAASPSLPLRRVKDGEQNLRRPTETSQKTPSWSGPPGCMTSGALDRMTEGGSPSSTRRSRPAQTYGLLVAPMPRPTTPCDTPCWTSADERALCTFRVEGQERTVRTGSGQRDLH